MAQEKIRILYIDDEENNLTSFKATFRLKYKVHTAISADEALAILKEHPIEIIITDQRMPGMTGVEFLEFILDKYPDPIRILLTGYADINAVIDAVNKGKIFHYLGKPWNEAELDKTIQDAYAVFLKRKEDKEFNEQIMTTNAQMEFLLRQKLLS